MSEKCEQCGACAGTGYATFTPDQGGTCPDCGGSGKAREKVKASDADHEEAAAYIAMTKRETLPDLIARVRAEGVAQGRAEFEAELKATSGKPGRIIDSTDDPKPMSRRDEFAKAMAQGLLASSRDYTAYVPHALAVDVLSFVDAVLAALDKEE